MHYLIRNMIPEDYSAIKILWENTPGLKLEKADSKDGITRYLVRNPNLSFVAEIDGQIIGTVLCGEDGRRGYLQHLCVENKHRHNGIAKMLLAKAIEQFSSLQLYEIRIFVLKSNNIGTQFWSKLGWELRKDILVRTYQLGSEL